LSELNDGACNPDGRTHYRRIDDTVSPAHWTISVRGFFSLLAFQREPTLLKESAWIGTSLPSVFYWRTMNLASVQRFPWCLRGHGFDVTEAATVGEAIELHTLD
jgi:hypothetical protein